MKTRRNLQQPRLLVGTMREKAKRVVGENGILLEIVYNIFHLGTKPVKPFSVYSAGGVRGLAVIVIENEQLDHKRFIAEILSDSDFSKHKKQW